MSEKFYCEYCGEGFSSVSSLTSEDCPRHPNGSNKGKHKLYEGREKSQFISRVKTFWSMYLTLLIVFGISYVFIVGGIENQYLIYALVVLVALALIAICVLSIVLPEENKGFGALLIVNNICRPLWKILFVVFLVIYKLHKEYGYGKKKE
ncbi:hypothetical protein EPJ74_07040 [Brachyspira aalborgi]|uniref:C2H2-type domain-containing protein n=1 Tax=Brachyspira aalborgi TaxID=29522 RepID=A0A5C8GER0_9SPIR|nr:hypothetical protein [Brachyspira aalborgi]TXJ60346.1 hypothetical protein EPJ74_07040 [Brachyspira aalborgi]